MRKDSDDDFIDLEERHEEREGDYGDDEFEDEFEKDSLDLLEWAKERRNAILIAAGGIVALVLVVLVISSGGEGPVSKDDFTALLLRVDRIESRVAQLDGLERAVADLIQTGREFPDQSALINRLDVLSGKVDALQKNMDSLASEAKALKTAPAAATAPERQTVSRNHTVKRGETLFGIARSYNVSLDRLLEVNKIDRREPLRVGQKLIIPSE